MGRKKHIQHDFTQGTTLKMNKDEYLKYIEAVKLFNKDRKLNKKGVINKSRLFRRMLIEFAGNPQKVLDFLNYDDAN